MLGISIDAPIISTMIPGSENITDIRELAPAMFRLLQQTMTEKEVTIASSIKPTTWLAIGILVLHIAIKIVKDYDD